ncbi:LacI family DNA-binding transcriptional regulator [Dactylosporangium sp. NPDC005555]|uniref:LacI family DNA-binding transcriptional regulator n=1 Tax=Dactylosporangium sp. NPDC005555 TaxID=3154889 RepID=UPI00339E229D
MTMKTGPTMAEIAQEAGVAISTVSKVLNGHTDVAAKTRETIERLMSERGYQRPRAAKNGRRRRNDLVDLVINELDSVWGLSILTGVEEVVEEAGLALVVSAVHNRQSLTRRWVESLLARGSEGAILVLSELAERQHDDLTRRNLPFVIVDAVNQPPPGTPAIGATNFAGGYSAAEHLAALGHRRIAAIGGHEQFQCTRARIAGYRAALESAGLPVDRRLIRYGNFHHDGGLHAAQALLELPDPPTAIFAGSDQQATGVYEAVRRAGLTIPGDISVVGFDDLNFAQWTAPPLTTVRQPLHEMGVVAARTLLRIVNGERLESTRIELATDLVVRESTAPPRAH